MQHKRYEIDENSAMSLEQNVDLTPFNTLALPGRAARYLAISGADQLTAPELAGQRRFILGGGSNLVLTGNFDGLVLRMAIPGKRLLGEDTEAWFIEAGAGENWHDFVQWTLVQGWPGVQFVQRDGARLEIVAESAETVVRRLLAEDAALSDLEVQRAGLADAFLELTRTTDDSTVEQKEAA